MLRRVNNSPSIVGLLLLCLLAFGFSQYASATNWALYIPAMMFISVFVSRERFAEASDLNYRHPEVWGAGLAICALPAISVVWSPDPYISLIETLSFEVLFASLIASSAKPAASLRWLPMCAGLAMAPFVVQGFYQALATNDNSHGWMHDSNLYAGYLTAGAAAVMGLGVGEWSFGRRRRGCLVGVFALCLLAGAYVGHSRGAWLALTIATACSLTVTKRQTSLSWKKLIIIVTALAVAGSVCTTHKTERDIAQHDHYGQSTNSRLAMWKSTVEMIKDRPIEGIGFGLWHIAYPSYRTSGDTDSAGFHAHNDYLEAFASGGVIGGLAVLMIPALWLYALYRGRSSRLGDPWSFVGVSTAAGVLVIQAVVNFIYHDLSPALLVGLCIGAMYSHTRPNRNLCTKGLPRKVLLSAVPLLITGWVLITWLAMVPTIILGAPKGNEAKYLGNLMNPHALTFLSRINPIAPDPIFALGQENMLDGLVEKNVARRKLEFEAAQQNFQSVERRQGVQAGTEYKRAMLGLMMPGNSQEVRRREAIEMLNVSLARNPGYWPAVNAYVRLMSREGTPALAFPILDRAMTAVPLYERRQFEMLRSELVSGQLKSPDDNL